MEMAPLILVDHLNHGGCKGDLICPRCGRRMCSSCVTSDRPTSRKHEPGHKGECLICSKMYLESEIKLWPTPWHTGPEDTEEKLAKIKSKIEKGKSYRRIVLT
jgi:hypothetical protein